MAKKETKLMTKGEFDTHLNSYVEAIENGDLTAMYHLRDVGKLKTAEINLAAAIATFQKRGNYAYLELLKAEIRAVEQIAGLAINTTNESKTVQ